MSSSALRAASSPSQIDALVTLLARRLPDWDYRQTAAKESGLPAAQYSGDPRTGWRTLVREAVEKGRVPQLIRAAADQALDDPELATLASEAEEGRLPGAAGNAPLLFAVGGVAVLAVGAVGIAAVVAVSVFSGPSVPGAAAPAVVAPASAVQTPAAQDAFVAAAATAPTAPEPADEGKAEPPPEPEPAHAVPVVAQTPQQWDPAKVGASACTNPRGEVLGYVFYNMRAPRASDEIWTLPRDLNVRTDYPQQSNHWNIQSAEIVCILTEGTQLELHPSAPAIRVEGGAWWVPVIGGAAKAP